MGRSSLRGKNRPFSVEKADGQPLNAPARDRWSLLTLLLGGGLMALAPEPVNAWWLAWIALVPLWRVVVDPRQSPAWRQLFGYGGVWSGAYHSMVLSWLLNLHPLTWMGVPWLASIAIALFAWGFVTGLGSLTFGVWAVVLRRVSDRCHLSAAGRIVLGTALWCFLETALSWGNLYWPSLSFTQSPHNLWILHLGQLGGPMLVTAAIVAVNGCWAEMTLSRGSGMPRSRWWSMAIAGLLLLVGSHAIGWGLYSQPLNEQPTQALSIGLIQGNIPTRIKLTPAGTRQAVERYSASYRALVAQGADAVLTPEGSVPEIWNEIYQARSPLLQAVRDEGKVLWLGTFRPVNNAPQYLTQSLVNLDAAGEVTSQYNKVKLVPLGEYIPFEKTLGRLISRLSPISSSLLPGRFDQSFDTPFGKAIIGICYESAYSELFRRQTAAGGQWIMTASNNDPYPPRMMRQHHAQDVMRAVESDRWSVRVTNTGISGLVAPHGETLWLAAPNEYVAHLTEIYRRQTVTPYVRYGNWLTYVLLLLGLGLSGGSLWRSRQV